MIAEQCRANPFTLNSYHRNQALEKAIGVATRWIDSAPELLTVAEMYRADAAAIAGGVAGLDLMEAAGAA
ncbi:hypothetical protein IIA29_08750, partial [candidate division KSB1 bacterium]|nr:hypothetical protein [candidate division KSB1 bacterium]